MKHSVNFRKFSRTPSHRRSMFRNLATSLLEHGRLETTVPKAKDLRRVAEKLITLAGEDTLHRRRRAYQVLKSKAVVHKLFAEIGPQFKLRPGGYTRVLRTRRRPGDAAEMAIIELVREEYSPKPQREPKRSSKKPEAKKPKAQDKVAEPESRSSAENDVEES